MTQKDIIIGWREWVGLPQLGVPLIKAKVDTGARTSCLHVYQYEEFTKEGAPWIRFWLHPLQKDDRQVICSEVPVHDKRHVTDSGGHKELRPVICTSVGIGHMNYEIEITLSNRESMLFRMLLGRTALRGKLLVNPALSFTLGTPDAKTLLHYYPEALLP